LGGLRIVKTGSDRTKSAAKAKLKEVLRDYQDGLAIVPPDYTVRRQVASGGTLVWRPGAAGRVLASRQT
jgi:hypothetical protein